MNTASPIQRCTKPPKSLNKSGISGLSGLWAQKFGIVPKVRNIAVFDPRKSRIDKNYCKWSENDVFRPSLREKRLFAPLCSSNVCASDHTFFLLKGMVPPEYGCRSLCELKFTTLGKISHFSFYEVTEHPDFHDSRCKTAQKK